MVIIENEDSFLAEIRTGFNLFLGAGFSSDALDVQKRPLPTGGRLSEEICAHFRRPELAGLPLDRLYAVIQSTNQSELNEFLVERLTVKSYSQQYDALANHRIRNIFTTNIDNLVEEIFRRRTDKYINDADVRGATVRGSEAIDLFHLNGSILRPSRPFTFTPVDLATAFANDPDRWFTLRDRMDRSATIFWGYALNDSATLASISPFIQNRNNRRGIWINVLPNESEANKEYLKALGLQLIEADTSNLLQYLKDHTPANRLFSTEFSENTRALFPNDCVPSYAEVPARPLEDFYRGMAPSWFDIYSGSVPRLSAFHKIKNEILGKRNVIIAGVPSSGKTTLLMQLAHEVDFQGHKLILNGLTETRAGMLLRRIGNSPTLLFVDNVTDDIEAFNVLSTAANVQTVCADRSHNLMMVSHLIPRNHHVTVDTTDLNRQDIQSIVSAIPVGIRRKEPKRVSTAEGVNPSLFEIIEANTIAPTLKERFMEAMKELASDRPHVGEMLLLISYVHSCRVPISMDMIYAYWRDRFEHHSDLYMLIESVGKLIAEYQGDYAIDEQDYFSARSQAVAEGAIEAAPIGWLKQMLLRFHENISVIRICNYSTFSRKGFDSWLIGRAFQDWREGATFYDHVYSKAPSPYLLQQKALFLSHRRQHKQAFAAIDKAVSDTEQKNWTILNSHAIVLFRANIEHYEKDGVQETLDRSMSILATCYEKDKRKAYHAKTYADHAMRYYDAYRSEQGRSYVRQAQVWLDAVCKADPWLIEPVRLLEIVRRMVRRFD